MSYTSNRPQNNIGNDVGLRLSSTSGFQAPKPSMPSSLRSRAVLGIQAEARAQRAQGLNLSQFSKGPSTNITRTLGFYIGNYDYGLGQVLNPKTRTTLAFQNLHHRSIGALDQGFYFLDSPAGRCMEHASKTASGCWSSEASYKALLRTVSPF